jgi:hypothetical protein
MVEPNNVIGTQIFSVLDFDHDQRNDTRVFHFVGGRSRHVAGLLLLQHFFFFTANDFGCTGDDDPVLAPVVVHLPTDRGTGLDFNPIDAVVGGFFQHGEGAPLPNLGDIQGERIEGGVFGHGILKDGQFFSW